jgi:predicted chitinase
MSKKGVSVISGNISPIAGEKYTYHIVDWYKDTPISERNPKNVIWELFRKRKNGKFTTTNIKKKGDSNFTFGEASIGNTYRLEGYLHQPEGGGLVITPKQSSTPKINKVELFYVDDTKGSTFSFREKLRARAYCSNMFNKELVFTLWEDDAKGEGHNANNKAIDTAKAKVNEKGVAVVEFMLTKALMQKAMQGETDVKQLEFYVTVEYYKNKKHASNNESVNNPFPQPQKTQPNQPVTKPKEIPKAKGSPAEQKPKSKKEEKGIIETIKGWLLWDHAETKGTAKQSQDIKKTENNGVSMSNINKPKKDEEKGKCPNCEKDVTLEQIKKIFPDCKDEAKLKAVADTYNKYMKDLNMNTCWNKAHLFAQARVEAGLSLNMKAGESFNYYYEGLSIFGAFQTKEGKEKAKLWGRPTRLPKLPGVSKENQIKIANYAYSPPAKKAKELENTEPNDGWNYRGRGLIQVTGKGFYKYCNNYTKKNGNDVIENPDLIGEKIELAVLASMIFFKWKGINKIANNTKDVKGKICPLVGKDVKTGSKSNYNEKQTAFDDITSKVFQIDLCRFGKTDTPKKETGAFSTYDSKYTANNSTSYIDVIVPTDRKKEGLLVFFDDKSILHQCYVLGLGTGGEDRYTNGGYGNVPNGLWNIKQELNTPNVGVSFGNHGVVRLSPKEGDALRASSRSGILLHCGHTMGDGKTGLTDNGALMVTHGCLRVYNKDMPIIQKFLTEQINKGKKVYIYVEETSDLSSMFTNYGTKPDSKDTVIRKNKKYDPQ